MTHKFDKWSVGYGEGGHQTSDAYHLSGRLDFRNTGPQTIQQLKTVINVFDVDERPLITLTGDAVPKLGPGANTTVSFGDMCGQTARSMVIVVTGKCLGKPVTVTLPRMPLKP